MHRLFVTEGIVLRKNVSGEANTLVSILSEEFGLVRAKATSTRAETSKLRYGLELLTMARFSFVQGRYEWKLTGVEKVSHELLAASVGKRVAAGRISKLLLRLIHGEEEGRALFGTVKQGLMLLARASSAEETASVECILVLRILSHLGYLPQTEALKAFIEGDFESSELALEARASRAFLIRTINESLMQTGL
ncbi:MAG: DNA repair protein RecO [Patescibacteria group bacterium]